MGAEIWAFAAVAGLLTITPGLDTALVLRSAIVRGRRHAFATAVGINSGILVWGAAAAVGVTALLTASEIAYTVLRLAGAAYLLWLGAGMLWKAWKNRGRGASDDQDLVVDVNPPESVVRAWAKGLGTNLLNPKAGVFYVAMLPQFIPPDAPQLATTMLLALVHNVEGMIWFSLLILGTRLTGKLLSRGSTRRIIDRLTGTILIGFGLKLALTEH